MLEILLGEKLATEKQLSVYRITNVESNESRKFNT